MVPGDKWNAHALDMTRKVANVLHLLYRVALDVGESSQCFVAEVHVHCDHVLESLRPLHRRVLHIN